MSEPNVEEELLALARLSKKFLQNVDDDDRSAARIIWHIIRLARHAEQRMEFEVHRPMGWSWAGFRIMVNTFALGMVEPNQLASILGVARPTVTSNLDKLERDGLILRQNDPENRRRIRVVLTDKGHRAVEQAIPAQIAVERDLVAGMGSHERSELEQLLHALLETLRQRPLDNSDDSSSGLSVPQNGIAVLSEPLR